MTTTGPITTTPADELAASWCRMRTDSPILAEKLVADRFRLWSDTAAESDEVRGPAGLARFLVADQERTGARYTPRVVAGAGPHLAYAWDAASPDGTIRTGLDVHRLDPDGRTVSAWSITGERPDTLEPTSVADRAPGEAMRRACSDWTTMWNGETGRAHDLVTDDFRIWFGAVRSADDALTGPAALEAHVQRFRASVDGVRFAEHGEYVLDPDRGRAALTWTVTLPADSAELELGGIDMFRFAGGRIARVWSITGARPHTLPPDEAG